MKKQVIFLCFVISGFCYSCGSKNDPAPSDSNSGVSTGTGSGVGKTASLAITDFSPKSAQPGAAITITGTGFGTDPSMVKLLIGNDPYYDLVSVSPTAIVFTTDLATPSGKISVFVNGIEVTSTSDFTALPQDLKIVGMVGSAGQINSGQLGYEMYLYAQGFGTDTNKIFISFGGTTPVKANYIGPDKEAIGTVIPSYAQSGKVTLTVNNNSTISDQDFNLQMSIRDFSPKAFHVGDTVTITGVSFTTITDMSVQFNDSKVTRPISVTPTNMLVIVPSTAKSGYLTVTANLGTITATILEPFTVLH